MNNHLFNAVLKLSPNANFYVEDGVVTWNSPDIEMPAQAEIDAEVTRQQAEYNTLEYARNRQAEYPDWGVQLNKIYDDGLTKWKTEMVDPIKAKYPKP